MKPRLLSLVRFLALVSLGFTEIDTELAACRQALSSAAKSFDNRIYSRSHQEYRLIFEGEDSECSVDIKDAPECQKSRGVCDLQYKSIEFEKNLIDHRMRFARALSKSGDHNSALAQLLIIQEDGSRIAESDQSPIVTQRRLEANVQFEMGFVYACMDKLDDAIQAHSNSFEMLVEIMQGQHGPAVAESEINARMLEIVKLYKWKGGAWALDANAMLNEVVPKHPRQWPARYNDKLGSLAEPWLAAGQAIQDKHWKFGLEQITEYLMDHHDTFLREWNEIMGKGLAVTQNECLFDPARNFSWRQYQVPIECNPLESKAVCDLLEWLSWQDSPVKIIRTAYSAVAGDAHIRPHTGPSNAQLKYHFGVQIPSKPCQWTLKLDNQPRSWVHGDAILFDDSYEHEVEATCPHDVQKSHAAERVVLQLTLQHPYLD